MYGILTLYDTLFQGIYTPGTAQVSSTTKLQFAKIKGPWRFQIWALPCSLAVTEGILVSFFSSAY